jgi:integrase
MMPVSDVPKNLVLPYIKSYRDSTGAMRRYFRKRGCKAVPLPGVPGSADFMRAYESALGEPAPAHGPRQGPGSVGALICDYLQSPAFVNLKPGSQRVYRIVLDRFGTAHGHRMVGDMPRSKVATYISSLVATPGMANLTHSVLRKLLAHAVRTGYRPDNPVAEIDRYKGGSHRAWTESELAAFDARWPLGTRERLAYALLLYTGQRGGDVVKMRRADISDGAIAVVQEKTGIALSIPIHPKLLAAIKAGPSNGLHLIGGPDGRSFRRPALWGLMKRAVAAAGLPSDCVPHGLRKVQMRRLAEAGATAKEISSISGHRTLKEVSRYTDSADQKRLSRSAIDKLNREQ